MKVFTILLQKVNDVYTWKELIMIACKKSECAIQESAKTYHAKSASDQESAKPYFDKQE